MSVCIIGCFVTGNQVMDLLQHIVLEHGQTLFIITHNLSHVLKYCQYIYVLKEGQIIERGILVISSTKHFVLQY